MVPPLKPTNPLGRGSVRERIRGHITTVLLLQPVIADLTGGMKGLLDISGFHHLPDSVRIVCPDAGKTIRLQFYFDREPVIFDLGNLFS